MIQKIQKLMRRPFFAFTAFYVVFILILFFTCSYSVTQVFHIHEQSVMESNATLLRQGADRIANSLDTCEFFSEILMKHSGLKTLMSSEKRTYNITSLLKDMPHYDDSNKIVVDYFVYAAKPNVIIGSSRGYVNIEQYYDSFFRFGTLSYDEWRTKILSVQVYSDLIPAGDLMIDNQLHRAMLYQKQYINLQTGVPLGTIVYTIDEIRLHEFLLSGDWNAESFCFVLDNNGILSASVHSDALASLYGSNGQSMIDIDGERCQVATYTSMGLTYGIARPYRLLWSATLDDMYSYIVLTGCIFLAATAIIVIAYFNTHKPLKKIADRLSLAEPAQNSMQKGLWQLSDGVEQLDSMNRTLRMSMLEQQAQLRNMLFSRLVQGDVSEEGFIEQLLAHINLPFKGVQYRGVYICLNAENTNLRQTDVQEAQLINELQKNPYLLFMSMRAANNFTCLFYAATPEVKVEEALTALYRTLSEEYGLECFFAVGAATSQLCDVHHSFEDAAALLENRYCGRFLLMQDNMPPRSVRYAYTVNDEQMLKHCVYENDISAIDELLNRIYQDNFTKMALDSVQRTLLYYRMLDGIESVLWSNTMRYHLSECKPTVFFDELREIYHRMSVELANKRVQEQKTLSENILAYIRENMGDANMSLTALAERFKMNEKYMSHFIHEHAGVVFSSYLENLRIEEARRLLQETDLPIQKISVQTGYLNANSFRRAFHRVTGQSPSQYRSIDSEEER